NRYAYCLNNPLMYTDPSGEFWELIIISAVFNGARCAVLADLNNESWLKGAICGGLIGGISCLVSGFAPTGWISSSLYNAAISSITNYSYAVVTGAKDMKQAAISGAVSGALFGFVSSEHFNNFMKVEGFHSNEYVFNQFVSTEKYQDIFDYFGIDGKYAPNHKYFTTDYGTGNPEAATDPITGEVFFSDQSFQNGYYHFIFNADHERIHSAHVRNGKVEKLETQSQTVNLEEYKTYKVSYKHQGLYSKLDIRNELLNRINSYGIQACVIEEEQQLYKELWWHFVYSIPRRKWLSNYY
ncbi:MAG: hypothetical protein MJY79_01410, partial [Bacteroidaceae bacterium]|nr:hypothetical protein [Bacteroidaceae bacterium]